MADIKIKHTDNTGAETTVEVVGMECGADDLTKDILCNLGYKGTGSGREPNNILELANSHEQEQPIRYNMRAILPAHITQEALKSAIQEGRLDSFINPFDEIDIPLDTGETITAVCGYSDRRTARFVFKDCWDNDVMNDNNTNKTGYFKSKGRAHVLEDILPHIAQEWRAIFKPRKMAEEIDGERVEYADLLWMPSATDVFGHSHDDYWKDIDDSFQLEIFKRERDCVKECMVGETCPWWLRSPRAAYATSFCVVAASGNASADIAHYSLGFAPGFDI